MRYYEVHLPGEDQPGIATNARALRNLPEGTRIHAIVTDRDGSLVETWEIPVKNGRAIMRNQGNRTPKL